MGVGEKESQKEKLRTRPPRDAGAITTIYNIEPHGFSRPPRNGHGAV